MGILPSLSPLIFLGSLSWQIGDSKIYSFPVPPQVPSQASVSGISLTHRRCVCSAGCYKWLSPWFRRGFLHTAFQQTCCILAWWLYVHPVLLGLLSACPKACCEVNGAPRALFQKILSVLLSSLEELREYWRPLGTSAHILAAECLITCQRLFSFQFLVCIQS